MDHRLAPAPNARTRRTARARGGTLRRTAAWPRLRWRRWRAPARLVPAHLAGELVRGRHHRGQRRCARAACRCARSSSGAARRARDLGGKRDGARHQVVDDAVDEARLQRLGRLDGPARHAHRQRGLHADQPRQPLRAFGAGDDAEVHLRQAELRVWHGHAVVPGHGHLEAAAERSAVDRHHDRLRAVLDAGQEVVHLRRARLGAPDDVLEALDVGAGDEGAAGAATTIACDGRVGGGLRQRGRQAVDGLGAEGVDRRVVDEDDGHTAVEAHGNRCAHGSRGAPTLEAPG